MPWGEELLPKAAVGAASGESGVALVQTWGHVEGSPCCILRTLSHRNCLRRAWKTG